MARIRRRHLAWRVESDYRHKLAPAERAYLDRFDREFHEGTFKPGIPVHPDALRADCYARANAARADVLDAPPELVAAAQQPARCRCASRRYLTPADYDLETPAETEAHLHAVIDEKDAA